MNHTKLLMAAVLSWVIPNLMAGLHAVVADDDASKSSPSSHEAAMQQPFRIDVVDHENGWPVPLVALTTTHQVTFVTDNAGVIAINQPELMGREVFFHVDGCGYEIPADGFGIRGVRLTPTPGGSARIKVTRAVIAKRIGRLTGGGLFTHIQLLGEETKWPESGVFGCDSVQQAVHREKLFWLWGDTTLPHYPLGIFHSSSATTQQRPLDSFEPPLRVRFEYFRDESGRPRGVAKMPGDGPTWLTAMVSLPDRNGEPRLVASYAKIKPPLDAYERGLCVWNEEADAFERSQAIWTKSAASPKPTAIPSGHASFWVDRTGKRWVLFGDPFPTLRCGATFEAWRNPSQWQPMEPQRTVRSARDGRPIEPHSGSIAWNPWRERWVTVFMQRFGKPSAFGELWYAEADVPSGPWGPAVKILSHDNYTFYNPRIHADLTDPDSPILLFEGTYTQQFADKPSPTPGYDYNQILYRLDLDDVRLKPAQRFPTSIDERPGEPRR